MYTIQKFGGEESPVRRTDKDTDGIPEQLKCPICFEVPPAEIYQCKNGHTICSVCQASVRNCPQCRVPFEIDGGLIRVRALESLLDAVAVPCPHKNGGCMENMSRMNIKIHVANCIYNGKCAQLCKQLGYNCDFWTNGMNSKTGVDHFLLNHKAEGLFSLDDNDNSVTIHIQNLSTSMDTVKADGVWTPVTIGVNEDRLMILTLLNDDDRSVSWLCVKLSQSEVAVTSQYEVEFYVASRSPKLPPLKWKVPPISMLNSEEIIKCPGNRMPVNFLEKHYLDARGILTVRVSVITTPIARDGQKTYRDHFDIVQKLTGISICQVTPRSPSKRMEINNKSVVWPKLA